MTKWVMGYFVYILASQKHGALCIGVTKDLHHRVWEHREHVVEGFTKRHGVTQLVYCEGFDGPEQAIQRKKTLKKWPRHWKINLIERHNPEWADLFPTLAI